MGLGIRQWTGAIDARPPVRYVRGGRHSCPGWGNATLPHSRCRPQTRVPNLVEALRD
jgi:hypothetical protein